MEELISDGDQREKAETADNNYTERKSYTQQHLTLPSIRNLETYVVTTTVTSRSKNWNTVPY